MKDLQFKSDATGINVWENYLYAQDTIVNKERAEPSYFASQSADESSAHRTTGSITQIFMPIHGDSVIYGSLSILNFYHS
ncbi:hypothetical protein ACR784_07640 [Sphingobacterium multivorum]|uniref:hypothetical protein n=1 Tax=Sphingobacterium multivorum TaxID=28454 RepID=UPI003DA38682